MQALTKADFTLPPPPRPLPKSFCRDCSDRGMGRFWYDPKNKRRVWLFAEWSELPDEGIEKLSSATAICDCRLGMGRVERTWMTTMYYQGQQVMTTTYPVMEFIRRLAVRRQKMDNEQISLGVPIPQTPPPPRSWYEPAADAGADLPEVPL